MISNSNKKYNANSHKAQFYNDVDDFHFTLSCVLSLYNMNFITTSCIYLLTITFVVQELLMFLSSLSAVLHLYHVYYQRLNCFRHDIAEHLNIRHVTIYNFSLVVLDCICFLIGSSRLY